MAKPKNPLLSLAARGSIGDTLTFQKRGSLTIARRKPIPTDRKTDLQLAQRQVYRDAVAAWNALTPEEREAYRGVCPGLTPYQCYMKTALVPAPPPPPPVEQTEEQLLYNTYLAIHQATFYTRGQRLTIANRKVTKLGFWLRRILTPTGDVTFQVRKVSDDTVIIQKVWGDAAGIPTVTTYEEVEFVTPPIINEEVRIVTLFQGGNSTNYLTIGTQNSDVKPGEFYTGRQNAAWGDSAAYDTAYRYKYYEI